ncbi:zinc finger protein Noc-like [Gigantopelta aegis]|uniref:zinc finger protein Noc-like n=1 Tax=Gigantopelta aegis TaxID=1735272 RepID=UPI001B88E531|nr:zinc finger protein Noc-like [Gigantopelta aegis]
MLTSSVSQYLHPDYFEPLPTTLDAKKSPLALLAQTCSSIGKDSSPSKPIIPPLEKKENTKTPDKFGINDSSKRPGSGDGKDSGRDSKPGFRTVPPKVIPSSVSSSGQEGSDKLTNGDISSSHGSKLNLDLSPTSSKTSSSSCVPKSSSLSSSSSSDSHDHHHHHSPSKSSRVEREHQDSYHHSRSHSLSPHHSHKPNTVPTTVIQSPVTSVDTTKLSANHSSLLCGVPGAAGHYGYPPFVSPYDIPSSMHGYPAYLAAHASLSAATAAAAAAQSTALKANAAAASAAALSPYVAYTRVRTPSGATTLVPVCRDPYCANCQLTLQSAHVSSSCTVPGCAQCAHEKSLLSLSNGLGLPNSSYLSSLSAAGSLPQSLNSLYPGSALAAHQGLPYICNWVAGSDYCGKRFSSSEELLQHLRTHTSGTEATGFPSSYGLGIPSALSSACHGHLSGAAPPSPTSLRRAGYPTSLSPVSSLLASSRFHPYKTPLPTLPPTPGQPYAGLSPYYSPYTLYGQRLGAAVP